MQHHPVCDRQRSAVHPRHPHGTDDEQPICNYEAQHRLLDACLVECGRTKVGPHQNRNREQEHGRRHESERGVTENSLVLLEGQVPEAARKLLTAKALHDHIIRLGRAHTRNTATSVTQNNLRNAPANVALVYTDRGVEITWKQLDTLANRFANLLCLLGMQMGDVLGIHLPNAPPAGRSGWPAS